MSQATPSRKRKRDASPEVQFELADPLSGKIGPQLVTFPPLETPLNTQFECYSRKRLRSVDTQDPQLVLVGETSSVEFVSNVEETERVADSGCRYLLAVHNKQTGTVTLLPTPKSPHILNHTVKALKSIVPLEAPSKLQYLAAKTALGETFGTKKAKANIRAQERNKIDVSAMQGVMDYVMDTIDKGAEGLPTTEETKDDADKNRLIPPFSTTATDPAEVYALHDIIPEAEFKALDVAGFDKTESDAELKMRLAYRSSAWINAHARALVHSEGKSRKKNLKILLYISAMFAYHQTTHKFLGPIKLERDSLYGRMDVVPQNVVDSLLTRFSEQARSSQTHQSTATTRTLLLTHIFALCLRLDKYAADAKTLADDLHMPIAEFIDFSGLLAVRLNYLVRGNEHGWDSQIQRQVIKERS